MYTPFQLLNSGNIQNIQQIPTILNGTNVNELNNNLNIFEAICNLIPGNPPQKQSTKGVEFSRNKEGDSINDNIKAQ